MSGPKKAETAAEKRRRLKEEQDRKINDQMNRLANTINNNMHDTRKPNDDAEGKNNNKTVKLVELEASELQIGQLVWRCSDSIVYALKAILDPRFFRHIPEAKIVAQSYPHIVLPGSESDPEGAIRLVPKMCTSVVTYELDSVIDSKLEPKQKMHFIPDCRARASAKGPTSSSESDVKLAAASARPFARGPILSLAVETVDRSKLEAGKVSTIPYSYSSSVISYLQLKCLF